MKKYSIPSKKLINIDELKKIGISNYLINKKIKNNELQRLNNKWFDNLNSNDVLEDYSYIKVYFQDGVVCLFSAALIHGLTTYIPEKLQIAIERDKKSLELPLWPKFEVKYYDKKSFDIGREKIDLGGEKISIYDKERTIIELLKKRNKYGLEEVKEVFKSYLNSDFKDLNKLYNYAVNFKCLTTLKLYMEVLL